MAEPYSYTAPLDSQTARSAALAGTTICTTQHGNSLSHVFNTSVSTSVICDGTTELQFYDYVSAGACPRRAKSLRHYISSSQVIQNGQAIPSSANIDFYLVKEVSLYNDGTIVWDSAAAYDSTTKHFYHKTTTAITITGDDFTAIGAYAATQIGRSISDNGVMQYKGILAIGRNSYAWGILIGGTVYSNKIALCAQSGDGAPMYDVFPNDAAHLIDVEYNDGDSIVSIDSAIGDRLLVKKKATIVIVEQDGNGGYIRTVVSPNIGCTSIKGPASLGGITLFPDYNGLYSYSPNGLEALNDDWVEDWKALTLAQKESAFSVIDRINRQWIINANGKQYKYDMVNKKWIPDVWTDVPVAFSVERIDSGASSSGPVDFLTTGGIFTLGGGTQHNGVDYSMYWESNNVQPLLGAEGLEFDVVPQSLILEYSSSVNLSLDVYLDSSSTSAKNYSLSSADVKATVYFPLAIRCKTFRFKISATTGGASQNILIKKAFVYYTVTKSTMNALTV